MKDRELYWICLIFSLVSIVSLLFFSYLTEPEKVSIGSIDKSWIGREVRTSGVVTDRYFSEGGHFFFHLKGENRKIDVVIFKGGLEDMGLDPAALTNGRRIEIEGEVELYNKELEIIADKVIL